MNRLSTACAISAAFFVAVSAQTWGLDFPWEKDNTAASPAAPATPPKITPVPVPPTVPADIPKPVTVRKAADANTLLKALGNATELKRLLDEGANVNTQDANGDTLLINAAGEGYTDSVRLLLEYNADIKLADKKMNTAMHAANCPAKNKPWHGLEIMKMLLEHGADMNARDSNDMTPIFWAVMFDHLDGVRFLAEKGAQVTIVNNNKQTLLHLAASQTDNVELAAYLIQCGININAKNTFDETALVRAEGKGNEKLAGFLRSKGATE
jgi:uncharacterized protein